MVNKHSVRQQLKLLNQQMTFFGRAEVRELDTILNPGESLRYAVFGYYRAGSGVLVATDARLLLVDKRPLFLNIEDLRYEMISSLDFGSRMLDATVTIFSGAHQLAFKSYNSVRLRQLCTFIQDQITRARQLEHLHEQVNPGAQEWKPYSMLATSKPEQQI